ncbi:MAG: hypothetical protein COU69_03460 [Candidatus Pacebacteria bacterium CG10_big_fil_rev_8_21_14_0_10_56_10]|nr:MAG: hypothetical protein COU69_03460 [Candidatus Pacebacteria bacterium CG10_big_fil_rev_8_21_14_0_10_56_10]
MVITRFKFKLSQDLPLVLLGLAVTAMVVGLWLSNRSQDIRQQAATTDTRVVTGYPPPPQPLETPYHLGVFYMPKPPTPTNQWYALVAANRTDEYRTQNRARLPILGFYSGADVEAMDWQIKWAAESGINFFVFDDFWTSAQSKPAYSAVSTFLRARYNNTMQFAASLDQINTPNNTVAEVRDTAKKIAAYYRDNYFNQSNYLRVNGKPAVYLLNPFVMYGGQRGVLGPENHDDARQFMRSFEAAAGTEVYWILAHSPNMKWAKQVGIPAVMSRYVSPGITHKVAQLGNAQQGIPYQAYVTEATAINRDLFAQAGQEGMAYAPSSTTNFDERPRYLINDSHLRRSFSTGLELSQLRRLVSDTKQLVDDTRATQSNAVISINGKPVINLGAWNEWAEDAQFEPGVSAVNPHDAFAPLNIISEVFSGVSPPSRQVPARDFTAPTPAGKSVWRFGDANDAGAWWNSVVLSSIVADASADYGQMTAVGDGSLTLGLHADLAQYDGLKLVFRAQCSQHPCTDRIIANWQASTYPLQLSPATTGTSGEHLSGITRTVLADNNDCSAPDDQDWVTCTFRINPAQRANWRGRAEYINLKFNTTQHPVTYQLREFALVPVQTTPPPPPPPPPPQSGTYRLDLLPKDTITIARGVGIRQSFRARLRDDAGQIVTDQSNLEYQWQIDDTNVVTGSASTFCVQGNQAVQPPCPAAMFSLTPTGLGSTGGRLRVTADGGSRQLAEAPFTVTVADNAGSAVIRTRLQGITSPATINATITLRNSTDPAQSSTHSVQLIADSQGLLETKLPNIQPGNYDVLLKADGYLQTVFSGATLNAGNNTLVLTSKTARAGDFDGNNQLDIADVKLMLAKYTSLRVPTTVNNQLFDVNADDVIDIRDIALVLSNLTAAVIAGES